MLQGFSEFYRIDLPLEMEEKTPWFLDILHCSALCRFIRLVGKRVLKPHKTM